MSQYRDTTGRVEGSMDDAKNRLREGMDSAKSAAYDAKDYVNTKMHDVRDKASQMSDEARQKWESLRDTDYDEVWDGVKNRVRDNPGPSLVIAGCVGLALGVLLAGSSAAASRRR